MINFHKIGKHKNEVDEQGNPIICCNSCKNKKLICNTKDCLNWCDDRYVHPKYPHFTRKYLDYTYEFWEPKERVKVIDMILSDEDFEI